MDYITVREAAEKWQVSSRLVQQLCVAGRIPGARKFSGAWAIPGNAEKPEDPRRARRRQPPPQDPVSHALPVFDLMPLMNTPFPPGKCREVIESMAEGCRKEIAWAEYCYFSGQAEKAMQAAQRYLSNSQGAYRLSACLIYTYACLTMGRIEQARYALGEIKRTLSFGTGSTPSMRAMESFVAFASAVLLHLPLPDALPPTREFLPLLPDGLRAFALYVQAHYLYLKEEYARSAGMVEATLAMGAHAYPIPAIYLHLVAVMDYMSLKQPDRAQGHLLEAWEMARPDDLIEPFGEHHGLLGGMLEAVIKPGWPDEFKRVIDITYRFSSGWRRVHNPITGHDVADDLTTTEFAMAMLAARGWTNQEIAEYMNISANTVKIHISDAMKKLHVENRKQLKQYMLR